MHTTKQLAVLFAIVLFVSVQCNGEPRTQVHYINVGQAEAILLEFEHEAMLIDAGGECTCDDRDREHLLNYLEEFFERRSDLMEGNRGRIHTIIISHPHIDHTMLLMDVMKRYRVLNLVDGGNESGSGIVPLWAARYYSQKHGIKYHTVVDSSVTANGLVNDALKAVRDKNPEVDLKFLSGSRGCRNANNHSLILWVKVRNVTFLFTGDDEAIKKDDEHCEPEIPFILKRFAQTDLLNIDVYKVGHHGSYNGTSLDLMKAMTPKISVISAGLYNQQGPGDFHAWQYGHPRESAIKTIEAWTTNTREPIAVTTMDASFKPHMNRLIKNAIYCTYWDGDVVVEVGKDSSISVH
jgi:competence protein ComEC